MTADLEARCTAVAAVLADFERWDRDGLIPGDWQSWSFRMAAELRSLLEGSEAAGRAHLTDSEISLVLDALDVAAEYKRYRARTARSVTPVPTTCAPPATTGSLSPPSMTGWPGN